MAPPDILIVGNGILGYSVANALLDRDPTCTITILGQPHRPQGATMASGAMLGCFGEVTRSLVSTPLGLTKLGMGIQSTSLWPSWVERINAAILPEAAVRIQPGTFVIENAASGFIDSENYRAIQDTVKERGVAYEVIDPVSIPGLDPAPRGRPLQAMYLPGEGSINSHRLVAALAARAEASGRVKLVPLDATSLKVAGGRIKGLELSDGSTLSAAHVILAAGVGTQVVLDSMPDLARRIPRLVSGMGVSLLLDVDFDPTPEVVRTPNRAFACGLHAVSRGGRRLYIGATNVVCLDPWKTPAMVMDIYFLMQCAMEQIHQEVYESKLAGVQVGNRPISMDTCPLLGPTSVEGLWLLTGTYRDGLHLSPLLAQDLADRIFGGRGLVAHPFAPERKLISLRTKQQAIEDAVKHQTATGWEHELQLPKVGWHHMLSEVTRARVEEAYNAIESDFVMPIEMFALITGDPTKLIPYLNEYYRGVEAVWR